jgi:putative intracellular protease/amidase
MAPKKIIMPIPSLGFDPTEVAVTWRIIQDAGHEVHFATPDGLAGRADPLMISGQGLDPWGQIPGLRKLRLFGLLLRAKAEARSAYGELLRDARFNHPLSWSQLKAEDFDGLVLPGGHAKDMRPYLESPVLHDFVAAFFAARDATGQHKQVAAICHGVVLAARSISPDTGKSVLYGRKTTALTWALERSAWDLSKFIRFWDRDYYRTYVEKPGEESGFRGVEAEIKRALADPADFRDVDADAPDHFRKTAGIFRDSPDDERPAWIVRDGAYLSARWPGDVHKFAKNLVAMLAEQA